MIINCKQAKSTQNINRNEYLNSLPYFQELYLEWLVIDATLYNIYIDDNIAGYAYITKSKILVEFYLDDDYINLKEQIFERVLQVIKPKKAYVKSFDFIFMCCCNVYQSKFKPIGLLFRVISENNYFPIDNEFEIRIADEKDFLFLKSQKGNLYETEDELQRMLQNRNITMYCMHNDLIGCGFSIQVNEAFNYMDIGMWVNPKYRNQGYAKQIISHLKEKCLNENQKPICGCAIDNIGSRKTLESNGMRTIHQLIEFRF